MKTNGSKTTNPYMEGGRLSDVIAAIQAMSVYKFYKLDFETWSDRITGDKASGSH